VKVVNQVNHVYVWLIHFGGTPRPLSQPLSPLYVAAATLERALVLSRQYGGQFGRDVDLRGAEIIQIDRVCGPLAIWEMP
jgi:hypothetical protein